MSLAIPKAVNYSGLSDLNGKRIATSYPNTVKKFLKEQTFDMDIHVINGSVEIAPNIGLSEVICDIVSSGSTLFKNNLKEVEQIMVSEAVLTASPNLSEEKQALLTKLQFRIQSVLKGKASKYILLNAPNDKIDSIFKYCLV